MQIQIEHYCFYDSPIGKILLAGASDTLLLLGLPQGKQKHIPAAHWQYNPQSFSHCCQQLTQYFAGLRQIFDFKFEIQGTEFQQRVLKYVAKIPYGTAVAYSAIAQQIQRPAAVRAVGSANATNPIPIIVPCHRVIGKNGSLTGFGGGIDAKRYLLQLEGFLRPSL